MRLPLQWTQKYRVVFLVAFTGDGLALGKAVDTEVLFCGNVHQLEIEESDRSDPAVHCRVRLHVRIVQHTSHELCIHFYDEVSNTDNVDTKGTKGPEEAIELDFRLRISAFALIPADRPEA
jgi:hypothetical protein